MALIAFAKLGRVACRQGTVGEAESQVLPKLSLPFETAAELGENAWQAEKSKNPKKPSLRRAMLQLVRQPLSLAAVLLALRGIGTAGIVPWLLSLIVDAVVEGRMEDAGRFLGLLMLERICGACIEYVGFRIASTDLPMRIAMSVSDLVAKKAAVPGLTGLANAGVDASALIGREVNMLHGKCAQMLPNGLMSLPTLASGMVTLFVLLGWPAVFGCIWIISTVRLGVKAQEHGKIADGQMSTIATERLQILNNAMSAIKAIKYFAWEPEFLEQLVEVRKRECEKLNVRQRWTSTAIGIGKVTPVTGSLVTFVAYAMTGHEIRASTIFAANSVFMTLRFSVGAISFLSDLWKSVELTMSRVEKWLALSEKQPSTPLPAKGMLLADVTNLEVAFQIADVDQKVNKIKKSGNEGFQLSAIGHWEIGHRGKLTAICGAVGAGKTVLLTSLLGSVDGDALVQGEARVVPNIGYCPQKPFVITGTILDNILLGRQLDEVCLTRCLADSCLGRDLEMLNEGLQEVVGERGTTLSGGQQVRLCLARALYGNPALLLFDDPFAAVDAEVGRALLHALRMRCAGSEGEDLGLQGDGVGIAAPPQFRHPSVVSPPGAVVVLNQLPFLPNFDHIVFVKNGCVAEMGTFAEMSKKKDFSDFMQGIELQRRSLDDEVSRKFAAQEAKLAASISQGLSMRTSDKQNSSGKLLVKAETKATGFVSWQVWRTYLFAPGRPFAFIILAVYVSMYLALIARDLWMSVWADADGGDTNFYIALFTTFSLAHIGVVGCAVMLIGSFVDRAGSSLHQELTTNLMHAPMSYFDETPIGRISSRLGPDLAMVDSSMGSMIDILLTFLFMVVMMSAAVAEQIPAMGILFVAAAIISLPVCKGLSILRADLKRHSNNSLSPLLSNMNDIRRGAALVSAIGCKAFFQKRHQVHTDQWALMINGCMFVTPMANIWCHCLHQLVLLAAGILTFLRADDLSESPGLVAMYLSYSVLWGLFAMVTLGALMGTLTNGASLERLVEFKLGDLPKEAAWRLESDPGPKTWPSKGAVCFEAVCLRYRPELPLALDCLDLNVAGGEKLGIVGRTGAGKSSITMLLFRLVECEAGRVLIDGADISCLGLHTLRKAISMIPQEPIVMSGSVRYNLDPFGQHTEEQLQEALKLTGLLPAVNLDTLAAGAAGDGAGLSAGQKQLLTFGRTLLQDTRIVMMDEPTASVDMQTDRLVQQTSRQVFSGRTVLTIAHRLETVRHCDRIAVLEGGKLLELDAPAKLLATPGSRLAQLAAAESTSESKTGRAGLMGMLGRRVCASE